MNVLMIGWELPPYNSGGLGMACYGLSKSLSEKGVKVTFILPKKVELDLNFMNVVFADISDMVGNVIDPYTTLKNYTTAGGRKINVSPFDYVGGVLAYGEKIKNILQSFDHNEFDIIHAHDWLTIPAALEAKKILGVPLILHIHATEIDRTAGHNPNPVVFDLEKQGVDKADRVVPVSNYTKDTLIKYYNTDPSKIEVVHNGAEDISKEKLPPALSELKKLGYKIVLYLGRITLMKGPEYYVRAAKKSLEYDKKLIFVVTGTGDMQDQMMSEAHKLNIMKSMIFTGFLRGEEKDRIYQTADVYVMPSVSEPFGLTTLESIANGTPTIVSKQSGVSEVISHALKVDFWDIDEMANKILAATSYPELRANLVTESQKELKNLTWDRAANSCINIYNHLT